MKKFIGAVSAFVLGAMLGACAPDTPAVEPVEVVVEETVVEEVVVEETTDETAIEETTDAELIAPEVE